MKKLFSAIVLMTLFLTACNGGEPTVEPPTETPVPATETPAPGPTDTPDGYPAPATPTPENYPAPPTPTQLPEGYPTPGAPEGAAPDAYPTDEQLLVSRPMGEQCAEPGASEYATLDEAVNGLTGAGVRVFSARMANRIVCEACGCPTSEHFEMIIHPDDAGLAEGLGWTIEGDS